MNVQATADALFTAKEGLKKVKYNKSGSINENSLHPVRRKAMAALKEAGHTWEESRDLLKEIGAW